MPQPTPLQMLIDLASQKSDERTKALGAALSRESSNETRLALLLDYKRDYLETFERAQRSGLTAPALVNFHHFLKKLDAAIEQQATVVRQSKAQTLAAREQLLQAERKRLSLVTLHDRRRAAERVTEARREQRGHDEISARIAVHGAGVERKKDQG